LIILLSLPYHPSCSTLQFPVGSTMSPRFPMIFTFHTLPPVTSEGTMHPPLIIGTDTGASQAYFRNSATFTIPDHSGEKEKCAFKYPAVPGTIPEKSQFGSEVILCAFTAN